MNHPGNEEWMDYLYGEISGAKKARLKEHLNNCTRCRDQVSNWQLVMTQLDTQKVPKVRKIVFRANTVLRWAAAAMLMVGAGFAGGLLAGSQKVDIEDVRLSVESSVRQEVLAEQDRRLGLVLGEVYV